MNDIWLAYNFLVIFYSAFKKEPMPAFVQTTGQLFVIVDVAVYLN